MDKLSEIETMFVPPELTKSGCSFGDIPIPITFNQSDFVIFGVPIDMTTTFGKTASAGPQAIRTTSAKQIETLIFDKNLEVFEKTLLYDIGDLNIENPDIGENINLRKISEYWTEFDHRIKKVLDFLGESQKIPVILGGEHTISYSVFKNVLKNDPLLLHFDAHRDMKPKYNGMEMCHTTPFYHLLNSGFLDGRNLVQIGIRQADKKENDYAIKNDVNTFDAWYCKNSLDAVKEWIKKNTRDREIYISFDIDVYDLCYLPCTGTPEPFGLDPFQIYDIIKSIDLTANLIGIDLVETGLKNNDYREGTIATQTLLRLLTLH